MEIEQYPCEFDIEAKQREQYFMNHFKSNLNMIRSYRTEDEKIEQLKKDNRTTEQFREKTKKYYDKNKKICNDKVKFIIIIIKNILNKKEKNIMKNTKKNLKLKTNYMQKKTKKKLRKIILKKYIVNVDQL